MSINEYVFATEGILQKTDFLLPPWKSQILKNGIRATWTGHELNTDERGSGRKGGCDLRGDIVGEAMEQCKAVKIKPGKGCKDRQKGVAYTQDLCCFYRKEKESVLWVIISLKFSLN